MRAEARREASVNRPLPVLRIRLSVRTDGTSCRVPSVSSFAWAVGIHSAMSASPPRRALARAVPSAIQLTSMPGAFALPPQ